MDEEAIVLDGYDSAIIGKSSQGKAVYDIESILQILIKRDEMPREDAQEFFWANVECLYAGEMSPLFVFKGGLEQWE
tara:strand:+ start:195 stop:425 length:231 start_codon:yes stop_codon:yes gene_type:complete